MPCRAPIDEQKDTLTYQFLTSLRNKIKKVCGKEFMMACEQRRMTLDWIKASEVILIDYY